MILLKYMYGMNNSGKLFVDDCVYWYTSEAIGTWFVDTPGKIFHVKFLVYSHWLISIRISHMRDSSISTDKARYDTYIVANYLDTDAVKTSTNFYKTTFPSDTIFAKSDASTSDEQVEKLTREFNICFRACIG